MHLSVAAPASAERVLPSQLTCAPRTPLPTGTRKWYALNRLVIFSKAASFANPEMRCIRPDVAPFGSGAGDGQRREGLVHHRPSRADGNAEHADGIGEVQYSALLDVNTFESCAAADGETGATPDDIQAVPQPGLRRRRQVSLRACVRVCGRGPMSGTQDAIWILGTLGFFGSRKGGKKHGRSETAG
jgi:hypothetical protein